MKNKKQIKKITIELTEKELLLLLKATYLVFDLCCQSDAVTGLYENAKFNVAIDEMGNKMENLNYKLCEIGEKNNIDLAN